MNWKLVTLLSLVGLAAASIDVHANSLVGADKKKQSFVLSPKQKAKSFIDFGKLGKKPSLGRVKLKSKAKTKPKKSSRSSRIPAPTAS